MLGKDLLIAHGGRVLAAQRTCNLNIEQGTIETCSPISGPWRDYKPSTLGWNVSCAGLVASPEHAEELISLITSRQRLRLSFYDPELRCVRSGYALPTSLDNGADIGSLASYSLQFIGCGPLEKVEEKIIDTVDEEDRIPDVYYDWSDRKNHPIKMLHVQNIMITLFSMHLNQVSRVTIDTDQNDMCLYRAYPDMNADISDANNIPLYMHEIGHFNTDYSIRKDAQFLLPPGNYIIAANGSTDDDLRGPLVYGISLPTE